MNNTKKNPFDVERLRARLAANSNYKQLVETYSKSYSEIKDFNTPNLWDSLNTEGVRGKNPMDDDRVSIVSDLIQGKKVRVLNVGFGSASLEKKYFKNHLQQDTAWRGIDISPASVRKATEEVPRAKFELGNILGLTYKANSFDYVVSLEVIEHIQPRNTFKALKEIFRVVKPGQYFIVSVPLNEGLEGMIARGENPNAHVRVYTPDLIKAELKIVGFTIVKEAKLFAFHDFYTLKTIFAKLLPKKFKPNNIIVLAQKPLG